MASLKRSGNVRQMHGSAAAGFVLEQDVQEMVAVATAAYPARL